MSWDDLAFKSIEAGIASTIRRLRPGGGRYIRGYMLYDTYQAHNDVLAPIRVMAEFFRGVLTQPWPLIRDAP